MINILQGTIAYIILPIIIVVQIVANFIQEKLFQPVYHYKSQYFYKRIGIYDTEYLKVEKKSNNDSNNNQQYRDEKDVTIVFIPGNPGFVRFYDLYLNELAKFLDYKYNIYAVCHFGHLGYVKKGRKYIHETDYLKHNDKQKQNKDSNKNVQYNHQLHLNQKKSILDQQVDHKVEFMKYLMHKHPNTQFIFISHSIGSYIVLNILDKIPKEKILHSFKLFPALEKLNEVPYYFFTNLISNPYFSYIGSTIVHIVSYIPNFIKREVTSFILNLNEQEEPINDIIETMTSFLDFHTIYNVNALVQSEFSQVRQRQDDLLKKYLNDITLLYGQKDGWAPVEFYVQIKKDIPGIDAKLDNQNLIHAFVVGGSHRQAKIQSKWINDIITKKYKRN